MVYETFGLLDTGRFAYILEEHPDGEPPMVAAFMRHETVFSVLGEAARRRGARSLVLQLILSSAIATVILVRAPHWWSLAFLAGWSATYSVWGLIVRLKERHEAKSLNALLVTIAALGTALAIAGIVGVGLAIYSGNAEGVKQPCGKGSTNKMCQAWEHPTPVKRQIP